MVISLFNQYQGIFFVFIAMDIITDGYYDMNTSLIVLAAGILFIVSSYFIILSLNIGEDVSRSLRRIP